MGVVLFPAAATVNNGENTDPFAERSTVKSFALVSVAVFHRISTPPLATVAVKSARFTGNAFNSVIDI